MSQALEALEEATRIRSAGASIRRDLAVTAQEQAFRRAAVLILNPPFELQRMRVRHFLCALPGIGPDGARRILNAALANGEWQIGPSYGLGRRALTKSQRQRVASELMRRA